MLNKVVHYFFQGCSVHLSMSYCNTNTGTKPLDHSCNFLNVLQAVMNKKHLSASTDFIGNSIPDHFFTEGNDFGKNGLPVRRWGVDDAQIPCSHQRELQSAWYWRCRERKGVDSCAERFQFVFYRNPEFLLLVNYDQTQIFKFNLTTHNGMCTD